MLATPEPAPPEIPAEPEPPESDADEIAALIARGFKQRLSARSYEFLAGIEQFFHENGFLTDRQIEALRRTVEGAARRA